MVLLLLSTIPDIISVTAAMPIDRFLESGQLSLLYQDYPCAYLLGYIVAI